MSDRRSGRDRRGPVETVLQKMETYYPKDPMAGKLRRWASEIRDSLGRRRKRRDQ